MARELKYSSPDTDYAALQRELGSPGSTTSAPPVTAVEEPDDDDPWAPSDR